VGAGTPLALLTAESRQLLAVHRSKKVGLATLYREIEEKLRTVPPRDSMLRGVLEGILFRLHPLVQGAAAVQYAAGEEAIDLNEIVPGDYGVAVLEGGAFLDDFSKAFLLGWAAWHLYTDAVILRMKRGATRPAHIQIVFEEANKILAGLDSSSSEDESGQSTAEQFANMWRDSRKYGIWLHLITQSPSLIPPGILSSCNNIFVSQLKNPRDRDLAVAALQQIMREKTPPVRGRFADFTALVLEIQMTFDGSGSSRDILRPLIEADLLVLDELGAGKTTPWVMDLLYYLVNTRYLEGRVTFFTTNFSDFPRGQTESLTDRVSARIRSRLFEMCRRLELRGRDYRAERLASREGGLRL